MSNVDIALANILVTAREYQLIKAEVELSEGYEEDKAFLGESEKEGYDSGGIFLKYDGVYLFDKDQDIEIVLERKRVEEN